MAGWFSRFINNLARASEKEFAGKKMDCCELHRNQEKRPAENGAKRDSRKKND